MSQWVKCPICGEPDMRKETDSEGFSVIYCTNHNCGSNGGTNFNNLKETRTVDPEEISSAYINTDGANPITVLKAVKACANSWEGKARLLGNVRAEDIVKSIDYIINHFNITSR